MKIVLINLFAPFEGSKYTSGLVHLEPLGLEYVGGAAKAAGYDVQLLSPRSFETIDTFSERIIRESPDVIGIGPETYNFNQAKAIAGITKECNKNVTVVFGGYHVTALPEEVTDPVIDIVVQGEGEYTFVEVLDCLKNKTRYDQVTGISYMNDSKVIVNPRRERICDLDSLSYPLRNAEDMKRYRCKGVYYPPTSEQVSVAQIAFSRGCPYNCSYCASGQMWGRSVIYRDAVKVVDEIQFVKDNFGTNLIFFSDLTFNLHKDKVLELCEYMMKRNVKMNWFCGCRTESIDTDLISAMKSAGCSRIHYGIEALDELSLSKIHRQKPYETIEKALELTSKTGIITRAYLMIGYPWETRESLESINSNLNKLYIDDLRISFFTPFPGTVSYKEFYKKIIRKNWDDYTTDKPMFKIQGMQEDEILSYRENIFLDYYTSKSSAARIKEKITKFSHLSETFMNFLEVFNIPILLKENHTL